MFGNKAVAIKFTLQVCSVTAAWFLLWLYPSCCQKKKSYLHSLLNIQRAGISTWQMLLFTWRLDFTRTLIKFICRDRLNFLFLKLLEFVNQILLQSKQHVRQVAVFFRKTKDFTMEGSQRALWIRPVWAVSYSFCLQQCWKKQPRWGCLQSPSSAAIFSLVFSSFLSSGKVYQYWIQSHGICHP